MVLEAEGDAAGCLEHAQRSAETGIRLGLHSDMFRLSWPLAARAATATHDDAATKALVGMLDGRHQGELSPLLRAELALDPGPGAAGRQRPARRPSATPSRPRARPGRRTTSHWRCSTSPTRQRSVGQDAPDLVAEAMSIGRVLRSPLVVRRAEGF